MHATLDPGYIRKPDRSLRRAILFSRPQRILAADPGRAPAKLELQTQIRH